MTGTQTSSYYRGAAACGASGALSSRWVRQVQEPADEPVVRIRWGQQMALLVLDPTTFCGRRLKEINGASTLLAGPGDRAGGTRYELADVHGLQPVAEVESPDIEAPLVRCTSNARYRVTARVTVRRGRLSLVVPRVLEEAE